MIPDVLIKTELTARGTKPATAELFSPATPGLAVEGEPAQRAEGLSFAELSQSLMTPLRAGPEVPETEVSDTVDVEGLDALPAQENTAFSAVESAQAPELKNEFPGLLVSPQPMAQTVFVPVDAVSATSVEAKNSTQSSLPPLPDAPASSAPRPIAFAAAPGADLASKAEPKLPASELPVSAIEQDSAKAIPKHGEPVSAAQLSTVASGKILPAGGQALPQLPELRQWVQKALSDLLPATGGDGIKSAIASVTEPALEAGLDSDAGGAMRQGEGLNRSPETGLAKLATAAPGESDWQQLVERIKVFQQPRLQQVEMIVNQEQLGRMQLQVQVHEGAIRVQFAAGQAATQEWLAQQLPGLQSELEASGLKVDSTRVSEWNSNESGQRGDDARQDFESQAGSGEDIPRDSDRSDQFDPAGQAEPLESADVRVESGSGMSIFA